MRSSDVNREVDLVVTLYAKSAKGGPDIAVGVTKVSPNFTDQHIQDGWFALTQIGEGEKKIGEIAIQLGYKVNENKGVFEISCANMIRNLRKLMSLTC